MRPIENHGTNIRQISDGNGIALAVTIPPGETCTMSTPLYKVYEYPSQLWRDNAELVAAFGEDVAADMRSFLRGE